MISSRRDPLLFAQFVRMICVILIRILLFVLYGGRGKVIFRSNPVFEYGIFGYTPYEPSIARLVMQIHGDLAVDVGASLGQYTVKLASRFNRVIAVEPNPVSARILKDRVRRLRLDNVQVVETAVASHVGIAELHLNPENPYGGASIVGQGRNRILVPLTSLDALLREEAEVDFVKVDTEGAEWMILSGAQQSIRKIKRWMIELHDTSRKEDLELLVRSYGYATRWVEDEGPLLHVLAYR